MDTSLDTFRADFAPPRVLRHAHVQSLLGGWPLRERLARRRARAMLAVANPEILDCGDARLLGFHSPSRPAPRGLVVLLHGWEGRSEEHTSELQSRENLVCRLLLEKKKKLANEEA